MSAEQPEELYAPTQIEARDFLQKRLDNNLAMLGALMYEPVEELWGLQRDGTLAAIGIVVAGEANIPDALPTIMIDAIDQPAFMMLLRSISWPRPALWSVQRPEFRDRVEQWLGIRHDSSRGVVYFVAGSTPVLRLGARKLTANDTTLDLEPCALSAMALSFWMLRGWQVFGVIEQGQLLGHALAAYPIGDTEEVAAVFTAPTARRRGIASACVAAAISDIVQRGHRAVYVSRKTNNASIGVAHGLGMQPLVETWEIEAR